MSENIEFISAANLPATEAEEVDVLCVENGELKRKPGASLGGGGSSGGEMPDMVITVNSVSRVYFDEGQFAITDGSMDAVFLAVREGRVPVVKIRYIPDDTSAYMVQAEEYRGSVCLYGESLWVKYMSIDATGPDNKMFIQALYINSDGSLNRHTMYELTGAYYE